MQEREQTSPSDRACNVQIPAAPAMQAYLPPNPVLSFSDSLLRSYSLLILSHRFQPDLAEESGNKDALPHREVFPAQISAPRAGADLGREGSYKVGFRNNLYSFAATCVNIEGGSGVE